MDYEKTSENPENRQLQPGSTLRPWKTILGLEPLKHRFIKASCLLVDGFTPPEKESTNRPTIANIGEHKTCVRPPTTVVDICPQRHYKIQLLLLKPTINNLNKSLVMLDNPTIRSAACVIWWSTNHAWRWIWEPTYSLHHGCISYRQRRTIYYQHLLTIINIWGVLSSSSNHLWE